MSELPPVAAIAQEDGEAPPTVSKFEAWRMPRGNVCYEFPSRRVEAEFDTFEEAQVHAHQLNEWLARRPAPDKRYRLWTLPEEPTEARLLEILDSSGKFEGLPLPVFVEEREQVAA